ncbi:formate dehydrogenase alpha subunit [Desulfitispora alkaliphila]
MTNPIGDIDNTDFMLVIGSNTTEAHPVISYRMLRAKRERGAKLVVVDPRRVELAEKADYHLQLNSGSDLALLNAMAHVIIKEELWDSEFVQERTEGFEELRQMVEKYTPEMAAEITGIDAEVIREVARSFATVENAGIYYTMGITQHITGTSTVMAIANLSMLTGHIGKPYAGVNPLRGQNNVQGACDMGALPNVYTGYQKVEDASVREKFSQAWGSQMPETVGLTVGEMIEKALEGQVKAMYIMGENPVLSDPDANHVEKALDKLDLLVVQDIFLTETGRYADVVLPAASFAEKDGTFVNTERRVQRVRKAVEPVGAAKADWEIIQLIANRMGYDMNYATAKDIMGEINSLTPSYGGITYERLEQGGLHWPCPDQTHPGTPRLHEEKFTRGKGKFVPVEHLHPAEQVCAEYPFVLNTGRRLFHYHTSTMTRRAEGLNNHFSEEYLEVNPEDATRLKLVSGQRVKLISRRGEIDINVKVTDVVPVGMVFTSFHFSEAAINKLTNTAKDPIAKEPELKVCAVNILSAEAVEQDTAG